MKIVSGFFIVAMSMLALTALLPARAQDEGLSDLEKEQLHKEIRDFILNNPEIVIQAVVAYQNDQQKVQQRKIGDMIGKTLSSENGDEHRYGSPDALMTLVEYSDFECPYCRRFHPVARALVDGSNGQINWIYRHLPLPIHGGAMTRALASECAFEQGGDQAFWSFADAFFDRLIAVGELGKLAKKTGLDQGRFQQCLENETHKARVQRDMADAQTAGLNGTPSNILFNNRTQDFSFLPGAVPLTTLQQEAQKLQSQ